jgi:hypothetical protein
MLPSGKRLRRIAPATVMVDEIVETTLNTNKTQLLPSNYGQRSAGTSTLTSAAASAMAAYHLHCWMGGAVHGFIRPPPRLATKTMTMAASTGGPAVIF